MGEGNSGSHSNRSTLGSYPQTGRAAPNIPEVTPEISVQKNAVLGTAKILSNYNYIMRGINSMMNLSLRDPYTDIIRSFSFSFIFLNYKQDLFVLINNEKKSNAFELFDRTRMTTDRWKWDNSSMKTESHIQHPHTHLHMVTSTQKLVTLIHTQTHQAYCWEHLELKSSGSQTTNLAVNQSRRPQI